MSFRGYVSEKRRYQIRLSGDLCSAVEAYADKHGLDLAPAIRVLLAQGLEELRLDRGKAPADCNAALAALFAAEQAGLVVASILPGGQALWDSLAPGAAEAAARRLEALAPGEEANQ